MAAIFTAEQVESMANSMLDYYIKGQPRIQTLQDRPLLDKLTANQATFGAAETFISTPVSGGDFVTGHGFTGAQQVTFDNPQGVKRAKVRWYERHFGISFTGTEMKQAGITIVDSTTGKNTSIKSKSEVQRLVNVLDYKMRMMSEGAARDMDLMMHLDGTRDAQDVPGLQAILPDNPAAPGTMICGIDSSVNAWWRNRVRLNNTATGGGDTRINATGGDEIVPVIQTEIRQLRRFGGKPKVALCGSDWLDQLIKELRAKGYYTDSGWSSRNTTDISVADIRWKNIPFMYDPLMDDIGFAKRAYILDTDRIKLWVMDGEDMKTHNPARPPDQYVFYRSITWTGGLMIDQPNSCGIYEFK